MKITSENKVSDLIVFVNDMTKIEAATMLAKRLNINATTTKEKADECDLQLVYGIDGLSLECDGQVLRVDFSRMIPRLKPNNLNGELIVKAAKFKGENRKLEIIDATAGFGEDSFLLAAAGFNVKLYEYNPIIAALLGDGLQRAGKQPELEEIIKRMTLFEGDSVEALERLETPIDVILLDPMFPAKQKSALVKKKFQLIHQLEKPCSNEDSLLKAAIKANPLKIIIKRPQNGPYLANVKPTYSISGKAIRFDCLAVAKREISK